MKRPFTLVKTAGAPGQTASPLSNFVALAESLERSAGLLVEACAPELNTYQRAQVAQIHVLAHDAWLLARSGVLGHGRFDRYTSAADRNLEAAQHFLSN